LDLKAKKQAESLWDKQLAKIDITESNQDKLFFIPHCIIPWYLILHRTLMEIQRRDNKVHEGDGLIIIRYSLWDNFRARTSIVINRKERTADLLIHS
jgi:putative alpha-1,2-mannosidase